MQELEKILEEIDQEIEKERTMCEDIEDTPGWRLYEKTMQMAKHIIHKHLSRENDPEITRLSRDSNICGECSRRKWYLKGYEDGKKSNDGWIPVDERMPDEPPEYVDDEDDLEECIVMIDGTARPTTLRYAGDGTWWKDGTYYPVIAWRPLPDPYRTERSKK